jgi:hypothetical protein
MIVNYNSLSSGRDTWLKNGIGDLVGSPPGFNSKVTRSSWLVMLFMLLSMVVSQKTWAQTTLINPTGNGGFENGATFAANNWTAVNSSTDSWIVASVASPSSGSRCAYISSTPTGAQTWTYSQLSVIQHLYYDVTIPAGEPILNLTFKWKATGEGSTSSDWDNMKVFFGTVANVGTPIANTAVSSTYQVSGNGAISGMYKLSGASYNTSTILLSGTPGTTYRLVFSWKSDSSDLVQPPAAIDEVSLTSSPPSNFNASAIGGLWSSPATWAGGVVPGAGNDVTIPAGAIVTIDQVTNYRNLTVNGTLQWNGTANTMTLAGNLAVNTGANFLAYTSGGAGVTVNVAGNYLNDGYSNFALSSLVFNGTGSTLSGSGSFQGDGSKGIIRSLSFSNLGSNSVSTTQNIVSTFGLAHTAGTLNTGGKLSLDNTAQIYGLPYNLQVASAAVTAMGSGYTVSPVVFGAAFTQWTNITGSLNTLYVSGNNVYRCTAAANIGPSAPTHTSGVSQNLLWIGNTGTIGTPFLGAQSHTVGTQYFYGGNLYVCTVAGAGSTAAPPTHTSGVVASGAASFRYVGTPATVSVNFDSATGTVRSLNLTNAGSGYSATPSIAFTVGVAGGAGSGAAATAVYFQQVTYTTSAFSLLQKSGGASPITGGLTINSDQGTSVATTNPQASSGVGSISVSNGGVNYTAAPTVGFSGPTALNLVVNPGSGYTTAPTITVTGGTLVSGSALTSANFTITVNNGTVESVYLTGGTAVYSVPPTLAFSAGTATLAFPSGCWPTATANLGSNAQVTSFTVTNPGFGYVAVPTVALTGGTFTTAASGATARVGMYNLTLNFFAPATTAVVNSDDAAIPANRKINTLTLAGNGMGLNLSSGLTLYGSSPLSLTASGNAPGNVLDMGGNTVSCTWSTYTGTTSTFGATNTYIKNGTLGLTTRGGSVTLNFPFSGSFQWVAGTTPTAVTTGSSVTNVRVSDTAAPSNGTVGTGLAIGNRAFRVQLADIGTTGFTSAPVMGTNPTVTLNYNSQDALSGATQDQLFVADATNLTGAWTIRSTSIGASGALAATGSKQTATAAPGPVANGTNKYYAWATSLPTITDFSPLTLCANSGTFTITGTNFTGVTAVSIGGTPVTAFTVVSATSITGYAGSGTSGVVSVTKGGASFSGSQSITVDPAPAAPSVSPASANIILGGSPNVTATGTGGTLNWYNAAVGGTLLYTGATYTLPVCATSTLYVAENNGSCDGARTAVPVTVQATVITPTIATFCGSGGTTTLNVTPTDPSITYTWESLTPSASLNTTTGTSVDATITENSDFKVTATSGSCTATAFYSVGVYPLPTATVTTSASGVCAGTSATINSGLSAGNFTATCITAPSALSTPPVGAVVLANGGSAVVPVSGGTLDDGYWNTLPIGFGFNFFGTTYNTLNVGTNGTVVFGATGLTQFNFTGGFPNAANPANTVAVCARDMQISATGGNSGFGRGKVTYWTEGYAPNRRFIVQYDNCTTWYSTNATDGVNSVEAVFYETTGFVDIRVIKSSNPTATTGTFINDTRNKYIGLQNGDKTIGATAPNCTTSAPNYWNGVADQILTPQAWRFSPPANYTVTWTAHDLVTDVTTTPVDHVTNAFSLVVTPANTTTYTISYTNQTTGCTNALNSAQVTMDIISDIAPSTTAVATPATICNGANTTLSLTGITSTAGLTFQWQVFNGSTWVDIASATGSSTVVTPTAVTQYRCMVKACAGTPVASAPVTVTYTNAIDTVTPATRCGIGTASISATTLSSGASIVWYAAASGGTALFTGSPYTPSVTATTTYYVAAETSGCSSPRVPVTVTVTPAPVFALNAASASICNGDTSATFTDAAGGADYDTFTISPTSGVASSNLSGVFSASFNPTATTTYTITASQSAGALCNGSTTFTVTVVNPNVAAAISATTICLGENITLSASSFGYGLGTATVGNGTTTTSATSQPTAFCNRWPSYRMQLVYTAAELHAAGLSAGNITSMAFNIASPGDENFNDNFVVQMGTTASSTLTAFESTTGFTTVFPAATYTHTNSGVQTIPFSTPFVWNGTSNIIIDMVHEGADNINNAETFYTATTGNTVAYTSTASTNSASLSTNRPNLTFAGVTNTGNATADYTYAWTSDPVGYTATGATPAAFAPPAGNNTYYVTATNTASGCTATSNVTVTVNTDPIANITGGATTICLGSPTVPATIDFDTTVGAIWESSNNAVATVDTNGVVTPLTPGTTVISAHIFNSLTGCTTYAANPQTVTVYAPLAITSHPASKSVLDYDGVNTTTTTFTVAATGSIVGYQWQVSASGVEGTFTNLSNTAPYSGVDTATLTITNATTAISGLYYRAQVIGNSPCATPISSNNALLTVSDVEITADPDFGTPICTSGDRDVTIGVNGPSGTTIVWQYSDDGGSTWTTIDGSPIDGLSFDGDVSSTTLELVGITSANNGWQLRAAAVAGETVVFSNPTTIVVNQPAVIDSMTPVQNATVCNATAGSASFTVTATGATAYQWQYSSNGSDWDNVAPGLPSGASYTNANTPTLGVSVTSGLVAGPHYYRARISSAAGCPPQDSNTAELIINTPTVNVNASAAYFCYPTGTGVTLTASGTAATYSWSPSTGLSATTGASVIATPSVTTTYTVVGTETGGCTNSAQVTVVAEPAVTATISASSATVCPDAPVTLSVQSFAGGPSTLPGTYCVPTAAGDSGINNVTFGTINNTVTQVSPFYNIYPATGSTTTNITPGQSYPLTVTTTGTNSIVSVWIDYNRDGVFDASEWNQLWTNASTGTISVAVPANAAGGATGMRIRSRNNGSPNGDIDACTTFFSGTTQDYTVNIQTDMTASRIISWSASPADAGVDGATTASVVGHPNVTTTYTATVASPGGCNTTVSTTVTVQSGATISTQPVATAVCQNGNTSLSVVANGAGITYQWYDSVGPISGATSATLSFTAATLAMSGNYYVIVTPTCGAPVTSNTVALTVNPTPTATAPANQTVCAGTTSPISLVGTPSGVTFDISGGSAIGLANGTGLTAIPSFTAVAGTATISITPKANGCTGTAVTFVYTVNPLPGTATVGSNSPVCEGSTLNLTASTVSIPGYSMNSNSGVAFIDINGTGTSVGTVSDDSEHNITIPSFVLNGVTYTTARVGMNGAIVMGATTGEITHLNAAMPNAANGTGAVFMAPYWDDLDVQTGATIKTQTVGNVFIIQYTAAAHNDFTTGDITFQVQMNTVTGTITYVYQDVSFGDPLFNAGISATVGLQLSATSAIQYSNGTASLVNGQSITFTPNTATYSWTGPNSFSSSAQNPSIANVTTAASGVYTLVVTNGATGCSAAPVTQTIIITAATTYYADADGDTYGNPAVTTTSCTGAPVGYVANNLDCDDTNPALNPTNPCSTTGGTINLTMAIQGYYLGGGMMNSVMMNQGASANADDVEMMTVELRDATDGSMVESTTAMLHTDGSLSAVFTTAPAASYYIAVKGRNIVETWSAAPQALSSTALDYDFTSSASQAYGDNMAEVEPGVYGFFSGEFNADGFVEFTDYTVWETDANNFAEGDYATDLNGDGFVEFTDYTIWEGNANNFVGSFLPF